MLHIPPLSMQPKHVISLAIVPVLSTLAPLQPGVPVSAPEETSEQESKIADKLLKVVIPLPKEVLANQDGLEEALVVVMIPAAVLASAKQAAKAIAINVSVPADLVLPAKDLEKLVGINLVVPVPIDILDRVETIIALPQVLRPQIAITTAASLSDASSAKALSIPLTQLAAAPALSELRDSHILLNIPPQRLINKDRIADKVVSLSFPFPISEDALVDSTNAMDLVLDVPIPDGLLDLIDKVLSVPKLSQLGEHAQANAHALRYYDSVVTDDGSSEYIQDDEWNSNNEPMTSLIDAHVLFAQEILLKMQTTPNIVVMRRADNASPSVAEIVPEPFVKLLRPVRFLAIKK